jgi:hypothetical protein
MASEIIISSAQSLILADKINLDTTETLIVILNTRNYPFIDKDIIWKYRGKKTYEITLPLYKLQKLLTEPSIKSVFIKLY